MALVHPLRPHESALLSNKTRCKRNNKEANKTKATLFFMRVVTEQSHKEQFLFKSLLHKLKIELARRPF
jgi:hypothetical protein